jgi:hypothetical protein
MPLAHSGEDCHPLFIEVSESGQLNSVAAFNRNSLAKKKSLVIVCTYKVLGEGLPEKQRIPFVLVNMPSSIFLPVHPEWPSRFSPSHRVS